MNLYKLSFENEQAWKEFEKTLIEDGQYIKPILGEPIKVGHVPIDEVKDEEGNIIVEAGFHDDWAIDLMEKEGFENELLPLVQDYLIEAKTKYRNHVSGNTFKIITK